MKPLHKKQIIQRLRKGDRAAFESIYLKNRKSVFGLALRYLRDEQLAEDAVQDVFLKLWLDRAKLDDEKSLHGLLFRSTKNHVLNIIKIQKRRVLRQYEYARNRSKGGVSPEEAVFYIETEKILKSGIEQLPYKKRLIFQLKNKDIYSNKEIADQLGISIHTVKSQFYKANRFIRKFVSLHIDN